jgi:hypothetical protein
MLSAAGMKLVAILALPPADQLDAVLRAARLPVDTRTRTILIDGFVRIIRRYAGLKHLRPRPDVCKALGNVADALNTLLKVTSGSDVGRQAVSIIENGSALAPIELPLTLLSRFHEKAALYHQIYDNKSTHRTEYDNRLFLYLYNIYGEIIEGRPGNTYLLYDFTMKGAEVLGIKVNPITPAAFRMRIARMLDRQRKGFGSLAAVARDLPPVRFDQPSDEGLAMFGTMASIVSDLPLMTYWATPKRRHNKRSHPTSRVANKTPDTSDDDRS